MMGTWLPKHVEQLVEEKWKQYVPTVLDISMQPRQIPTQVYNITQYSALDDGHNVARNMLSN